MKTTYGDTSDDVVDNTATMYAGGDSLLIQEATPSITKTESSSGNSATGAYQIDQGDSTVSYTLTPSFGSSPYETTLSTVTITDTLPEGMEYVAGSAKTGTGATANPAVTSNQDGTTTLTWTFTNVTTTDDMSQYTITYDAEISGEVDNNETLTNTATITYDGILDDSRTDDDLRADSTTVGNMSQVTVTASKLAGLTLYKKADESVYEATGTVSYTLYVQNTSSTEATNTLILDVLPYSGNDSDSTISGTFTLSGVDVPSGWTAYYTYLDHSAIGTPTADAVLSSSDWLPLTSTIPTTATAIAWIGDLAAVTGSFEATVSLDVSGMSAGDVLVNTMYYNSDSTSGSTYSSTARAYIASRTISGLAWLDSDENSIRTAGDTALSGIKVTLLQLSGDTYVPLQDASGSNLDVSVTTTTGSVSSSEYTVYLNSARYKVTATALADGTYEFSGLPAGTYAVKFESTSSNSLAKYVACEVDAGSSDYVDSDAAPTYSDSSSASSESNQLDSTQISGINLPETISAPSYTSAFNDSGFQYKKGSITITKTSTDGATLQGAVFKIEKSTDGGSTWTDITSDYDNTTTDANGTLKFSNLDQNATYKITETSAASGYALSDPVTITLPADTSSSAIANDTQSNTFTENGTDYTLSVSLVSAVATGTGEGIGLPFTGFSPLSAIFFVLGVAIMALAAYALYRQRRSMRTCAAHAASYAVASPWQARTASRPRPTRRRVR